MTDDPDPDDPLSGIVDDLTDAAAAERGDGDTAAGTVGADPDEDDGVADREPPDIEGTDDDSSDGVDDAPLGDLAARIDDRRTERAAAAGSELFSEQSAEGIDSDRLWEQVSGEADGAPPDDGVGSSPRDERVISKRSYCQGCEHFSAPPDVRCDRDGTEILEVVNLDRFRVVDCPVVREDELLDEVGDGRDDR